MRALVVDESIFPFCKSKIRTVCKILRFQIIIRIEYLGGTLKKCRRKICKKIFNKTDNNIKLYSTNRHN